MSKRTRPPRQAARTFVLDSEALSLAVRGDRRMIALLELAAHKEAQVVTSPMTLMEAHDGRITERRWDWVLSRISVAELGKDDARLGRRLLSEAGLHGHTHAIDAALAVVARRQTGQITVFTSDPDDVDKLVGESIVVRKV